MWELILGNLSVVDRLSCVTSMKVMIKKLWKEGGKIRDKKGKRGCKKKSGGGPPDLSGAGSRDGCLCLKVLQVPKKKMPP